MSGSSSGASSGASSGMSSGGGASGMEGGSGGTIASGADAAGSRLGSSFLSALGKQRLIVGVSGSNAAEGVAPYDLRYVYLSGGLFSTLDAVHFVLVMRPLG